ncbi:MAG TPA: L-type lectin-domain containing protein [Terriglobales bacterium]|nr:L-type lectin-domain containing protein [Terriglobales bacterium]
MASGKRLSSFVSVFLLLLLAAAAAQQIRYIPDFTSATATAHLQLNGSRLFGYQSATVLRLTDPDISPPYPVATSTYFKIAQPVVQGFTTYFAFQMHHPTVCCTPGDGFAFVIQNSTNTDSTMGASGKGIYAVGAATGGVGYAGINNSLAIEFDILQDPWDPSANHVAIQTCGGNLGLFNTPVHLPGVYTIGNNHHVTSCLLSQNAINSNIPTLGPTCSDGSCTDGAVHQVVIEYVPPSGQQSGSLLVYLDPVFQPGTHTPIVGSVPTLNVPYNLMYSQSNPLGLALANISSIFVGFTASMATAGGTTTDILAWEFTPQAPTLVTQIIPPGGVEADYTFGGHQLGVTYPSGFQNPDNITMSVLATPVNQQTFYTQRLQGTQFADENCIIYLETGGNCVDYSVTCHDASGQQITCPQEPADDIAICSQFYTSEPTSQTNTDFLEAEPIGSNNWCSIWTGFQDNPQDGIITGKGTGFSDIVATLSPTGPGPQCGGGRGMDLRKLTEEMRKITTKQVKVRQQPSGFCPAIQ